MAKIAFQLAVLLTVVSACCQCPQDFSGLLDQVTANSLQSLHSLRDYVWVLETRSTWRNGKGKIQAGAYREERVVANGKMYSRALKPGEDPTLPESEAALSADYSVAQFECEGRPCLYPWAFLNVTRLGDLWNVQRVQDGELQGKKVLLIDLQSKHLPHPGFGPISGTAWVDPERCRVVRLQINSAKPNGHDQSQEVLDFGEVKGAWLPVRRENHSAKVEAVQEFTYLKFGVFTRIEP